MKNHRKSFDARSLFLFWFEWHWTFDEMVPYLWRIIKEPYHCCLCVKESTWSLAVPAKSSQGLALVVVPSFVVPFLMWFTLKKSNGWGVLLSIRGKHCKGVAQNWSGSVNAWHSQYGTAKSSSNRVQCFSEATVKQKRTHSVHHLPYLIGLSYFQRGQ